MEALANIINRCLKGEDPGHGLGAGSPSSNWVDILRTGDIVTTPRRTGVACWMVPHEPNPEFRLEIERYECSPSRGFFWVWGVSDGQQYGRVYFGSMWQIKVRNEASAADLAWLQALLHCGALSGLNASFVVWGCYRLHHALRCWS
jgi:hypothetical protein